MLSQLIFFPPGLPRWEQCITMSVCLCVCLSVCMYVHIIISVTRRARDLIQISKWSAGAPPSNSANSSHHHDQHQDDQEAPGHPLSTRMFLMAPLHYWPHVSYISGNLGQNPIHWRWLQVSWSPSWWSGRSGTSSKYKDVLGDSFENLG